MNGQRVQLRPAIRSKAVVVLLTVLIGSPGVDLQMSHAQTPTPITPSGLGTQVNLSATPPAGKVQYDITGGTRPGGGPNLFHSFGEFGVPTNNIANFFNETALPTSNVLGRITGGNISNIFGTVQTTNFGNANLFLVNPAGFLFGPNATVNVAGMVAFTSADYLKLTDSVKFNAIPNAAADALLTASPVAAFGFLGSNPGAITVQGSQITVSQGQSISQVGGNITVQSATLEDSTVQPARLSAPGGQINLVSVASPGEVLASTFQPTPGMAGGSINLSPGTFVDVSGNSGGTVRIRGGSFVIDNATISADSIAANGAAVAIDIQITENVSISTIDVPALTARTTGTGNAGEIKISSGSVDVTSTTGESIFFSAIDTHTSGSGNAGNVTISTGSLTVTGDPLTGGTLFIDSGTSGPAPGRGGDVSIMAKTIDLQDTLISTGNLIAFFMDKGGAGTAGNVTITADRLQMTLSQIVTDSNDFIHPTGTSGDITITAQDLNFDASGLSTTGNERSGSVTVTADQFVATESQIQAITNLTPGGDIKITGNVIEFRNGSNIASSTMGDGDAGPIIITATNHLGFLDSSPGGRPSGIFNNSFGENGSLGKAGDVVITTPSLQLTGGARINTTTATSGAGGNVTINASNSISMSGENSGFEVEPLFNLGTIQSSGIYTRTIGGNCIGPCGNAGDITIQTGSLSLGSGSQINSGTTSNGRGGNMSITASDTIGISGTLSTGQPGGILSRTIGTEAGAGNGGNILLNTNSITIQDGAQLSASSLGPGAAGNVTVEGPQSSAQSVLIDGPDSGLFTDTVGTGAGGNIFVNANTVTLQNGGTLSAATSGTEATATGGTITIAATDVQLSNSAAINAQTTGAGNAGEIFVQARDVSLSGFSLIRSDTTGAGQAGTVRVAAEESISLTESAIFSGTTSVSQTGSGGQIILTAPLIDMTMAQLNTLTTGPARAGDITVATSVLNMKQESEMNADTSGPGRSGSITIRGMEEGSKAQDVTISGSSFVVSETLGDLVPAGNAGNLLVETARLTVEEGGSFRTSSRLSSPGNAGTVTVNASESVRIMSGSGIESNSIEHSTGNAGEIKITAPVVTVEGNSFLSTSTELTGNAGPITIRTGEFRLASGGRLASSSVLIDETPTGAAGSIIVQGLASPAQSVVIDGAGSGIFTEAQGTGAGGNIFVNANTVTLQNGGTLSAKTSGPADTSAGGTIEVTAIDTMAMTSGASMSASSSGLSAAGNIDITAPNGFTMQNSTITTQAGQGAGGGNIKVTTSPEATVWLQNSMISASVADGPGGGGNISIDPQFVILQNSQILAQAAQGQGGAITITASLFLPDANSIVNANSGSGLNGTVTIQSPNAPASGKIQPLGKSPLQATSLLNQRCAALAGGEFSSFTVAGRDSLPTEPGSWLASPLYAAGVGEGQGVRGKGVEGLSASAGLKGDAPILSLRQIAPAGFLTQAFTVDWSAGCQS